MRHLMVGFLCAIAFANAAAAHEIRGHHVHRYEPPGLGAHHLPLPVPTRIRLGVEPDGRFKIFVTPNVLTYRQALGLAARRAADHCGSRRSGIPARIDVVARHAYSSPESWGFSGTCR